LPLTKEAVIEQAKILHALHVTEREALDRVRRYWRGRQALPGVVPEGVPIQVRRLAEMSRVNVCRVVIDTLAQSMFVDGFRAEQDAEDAAIWSAWQANKLDARQTGIHRATFAYGAGYAVVLPGDSAPVIRGVSPRNMTVLYGEDPDWPIWGFERLGRGLWRLYDDSAAYYLSYRDDAKGWEWVETAEHGLEVTPVVRYLDEDDLDAGDDVPAENDRPGETSSILGGQITPLMPIQDQVDFTTFGLLTAQHYAAFRQRYAIGWVAPSEKELMEQMLSGDDEDPEATARAAAAARRAAAMQAGADRFWTFDENPEDMKIGEFAETNLEGYIRSREASLRHAATLSQTPVHELIGEMINLSAEALVAAENGRERKVDERKALLGESHEQTLWLAGKIARTEIPDDAQVVWRDTSARAFNTTVEALSAMVEKLGVPAEELWERIPGVTRQDIERWKKAAKEGNSFDRLTEVLNRQATPPSPAPA
jgi:hypothetical protein